MKEAILKLFYFIKKIDLTNHFSTILKTKLRIELLICGVNFAQFFFLANFTYQKIFLVLFYGKNAEYSQLLMIFLFDELIFLLFSKNQKSSDFAI